MSSRSSLSSRAPGARPSRSDAIALHVLLAATDPQVRSRIEQELHGAMPTVVDAVTDIAECAAALHEAPYDIVVADTDVAGFDDPILLRLARDTQPTALRVGLVGGNRSDVALAMLAHLAIDPRNLDGLGERLRLAAALQRTVEDPIVRSQVAQCQVLPSAPTLYAQLATVLANDEVGIDDVCEVVQQDQEVVARILQLTNSAFTGRVQPTSNVAEAVAYVGLPSVRGLVLTMEVLRAFRQHDAKIVQHLALQLSAHAQDVANLARVVAPTEREAFTAGLLHDIGKLVLAANDPDGWSVVESLVAADRHPVEAEMSVFGCSHDGVGASLLATWGLPGAVVEAVAHHHVPAEVGAHLSLAGAVHVADALSHESRADLRLDHEWLASAGLEDRLPQWQEARALPAG